MIIGVDPGITGGIASLSRDDGLWIEPMPRTEKGIDAKELLRLVHELRGARVAYIEKIFAMQKSGAHSMMKFGMYYGMVIGIITAVGIPIIEVTPQQWQKVVYSGVPESEEKKKRSAWAFKRMFPGVDATLSGSRQPHMGMVEAALIAEYGRRQHA